MVSGRRLPPLSWLLAFEAAARYKSFSSAASALGTSQPAISQRIAHLESELGVPLFRRLPRGVQLTSQGSHLLTALNDGLDLIETAFVEMCQEGRSDRLTVATDFGFAAFWLIPRLESLRLAVPQVDVRVVTSQTTIDLHREPVDVAIVFGPGQWPGCIAEPILPEIVTPICAPSLLAERDRPVHPADLMRFPLLHVESDENTLWLDWAGWFRAAGCPPRGGDHGVTINNYSLVIQAALAGQGIALGWRPLIDDLLAREQLVPALDHSVRTDRGYYFVHTRGRSRSKAVRLFRQWMADQLA